LWFPTRGCLLQINIAGFSFSLTNPRNQERLEYGTHWKLFPEESRNKKEEPAGIFERIGKISMQPLFAWIPAPALDRDPGFAGMALDAGMSEG